MKAGRSSQLVTALVMTIEEAYDSAQVRRRYLEYGQMDRRMRECGML
jgi:hypothetical protein